MEVVPWHQLVPGEAPGQVYFQWASEPLPEHCPPAEPTTSEPEESEHSYSYAYSSDDQDLAQPQRAE